MMNRATIIFAILIGSASKATDSSLLANPLIPEVLKTCNGCVVPKDVYEKYSSRQIGVSIIQKIFRQQEQAQSNKVVTPLIDFKKEATIQMAFYSSHLNGIIQNGFLNQHQIKWSGGAFAPETRANREDAFLGYRLEEASIDGIANPVNMVRPKYAYLGLKNIPITHPPDVPEWQRNGSKLWEYFCRI